MKCLFAPWRTQYTKDADITKHNNILQDQCVFCKQLACNNDEQHFILRRFEHNIVILNLFPYNAGHLLVMPLTHHAKLEELSKQTRTEMMELVMHCTHIVQKILKCEGVNVGLNLGKAAGAGIPSHLHMHVLPRWTGDTNFLPIFGETKQISFDLTEIYKKLKPEFDSIKFI